MLSLTDLNQQDLSQQCRIFKKFGDYVFSWGLGDYYSEYQQIFINIILHTFTRCSFKQNTRTLIGCLKNLSKNINFLFLFFMFGDIFLGTQCLSTSTYIQFSMWMRFCCDHAQKFYWDEGMPGEQPPCKKRGISVLFFL